MDQNILPKYFNIFNITQRIKKLLPIVIYLAVANMPSNKKYFVVSLFQLQRYG